MKKRTTLLFLLLTTCILVQAQIPSIDQFETEPVSVTTGITFKFPSKSLGEDRVVWISVPAGYQESMKKYPVLYMLDAQWSFSSTAQALEWLSNRRYGLIPQTIVVGIHTGGDNRARDLTPTQDAQQNIGGGADKLYDFIKDELIPFVDKNYRTYNYRVIGGASLSGLFVAYAFTKDNRLFDGYLCQSPSMWWDSGIILKEFSGFLSENPDLHSRMYVTMANEGVAMGVDSLAHMLETYPGKQLKWKYDKNPDEVHETIGYKGTWDGMKFLLADWYYPWYNFGSEASVYAPKDPAENITHKAVKVSDKVLESYAGMYVDSLKRVLIIEINDKNLILSAGKLPTLTLYPEAENTFFVPENDIRNDLFMEGVDFQFEFADTDSLVMKVNGQVDCIAKKVNDLKPVTLPDEKLSAYEGIYDPMQFGNSFRVLKEGHFLKVQEILSEGSEERHVEYLYPVGENTFIIFLNGTSYDVQYKEEGSIFTFSTGGNTVLMVKKRDE